MEMTEGEILKMYRQARDKGGQIQILADLNGTKRINIIQILLYQGEEVRVPLPVRGKKRKKELTKKEYRTALLKRLDELDAKIAALETAYREIAAVVKAGKE